MYNLSSGHFGFRSSTVVFKGNFPGRVILWNGLVVLHFLLLTPTCVLFPRSRRGQVFLCRKKKMENVNYFHVE